MSGSTSVPALVTGLRCAQKNIISLQPQPVYGLNLIAMNSTTNMAEFNSHVNQAKDIIESFVTIVDLAPITINLVDIEEDVLGYADWQNREIGINQAVNSSTFDMIRSDGNIFTVHKNVALQYYT